MAWKIESIEATGSAGMHMATLGCRRHGAAVTVIGIDLTECCERALAVISALDILDEESSVGGE